jgi:hypothetical protein
MRVEDLWKRGRDGHTALSRCACLKGCFPQLERARRSDELQMVRVVPTSRAASIGTGKAREHFLMRTPLM